ncbi:MAG: hypothetical protein NC079_01450 [Clostridium sp.]|nr:hypothetical protein [Acetatifactor muris]MCM1525986.1 hypothetical protein [Bacteroides sp.]MCM1562254.1 hypothetical protein [Clostridium sp.]
MAMGSIEFTTISRAQDYTTIKQNEDNKAVVDQTNLGQQAQRTEEQRANSVRSSDQSEWQNKRQDARDKGSNEYTGDGGKHRRKNDGEGRVVIKGQGGFDMKV